MNPFSTKSGRKDGAPTTKQIILSVKACVIEREKAQIGVLISMEPPTKPMLKEAAEAKL